MAPKALTLAVGFDLQTCYDQARVLSVLYAQFADNLAEHGGICHHRDTVRTAVDDQTVLCHGCQRTVPVMVVEGS